MKITRYMPVSTFIHEANALRLTFGSVLSKDLERLEKQRSLIPRLRLHYPDTIERRWWVEAHPSETVDGELEPNGPRWNAACELERARQKDRWEDDPRTTPLPLDDPHPQFLEFIEQPADLPFVPWKDFHVPVSTNEDGSKFKTDTVLTYYTSWQLLVFAEVFNMGALCHMNLLEMPGRPTHTDLTEAPKHISLLPVHALRDFKKHAAALDAIVWYAEEKNQGYMFATRKDHHRRVLDDDECRELDHINQWVADQSIARHAVTPDQLRDALRFLCEQWAHWKHMGRPIIAKAYKAIAAHGVRLACQVTGKTVDEYRMALGRAGGYFAPIMDVIWPDWEKEQRSIARQTLISFAQPSAILKADFTETTVDAFLDFIEQENLHGFYWRLQSFNKHAFKGNGYALEGLKGDVQGMSVVLEHIALALGSTKVQLRDKFKELWARNDDVPRLLKDNKFMKVGNGQTIDLEWFEEKNRLGVADQVAADLAISYAIRGGAHRVIEETNPLRLEKMMLILIRAAVRTFEEVKKNLPL